MYYSVFSLRNPTIFFFFFGGGGGGGGGGVISRYRIGIFFGAKFQIFSGKPDIPDFFLGGGGGGGKQ